MNVNSKVVAYLFNPVYTADEEHRLDLSSQKIIPDLEYESQYFCDHEHSGTSLWDDICFTTI